MYTTLPLYPMMLSYFLNVYFIDYAITVVPLFLPFIPLCPTTPLPPAFPTPLSSCPWVVHISSLASPFPILFSTFPYFVPTIYASYSLYLSPHSPSSSSPLITLHVISISVILFLFQLFAFLVFIFVLGSVVDGCEFCHFTVHIFDLLFLR